jgi:hypothetical protein
MPLTKQEPEGKIYNKIEISKALTGRSRKPALIKRGRPLAESLLKGSFRRSPLSRFGEK